MEKTLEHVEVRVAEPDFATRECDSYCATRELWLDSLKGRPARANPSPGEMHKIPLLFSRNGKPSLHYRPKVVSLGPYHRGNAELTQFQERKASMAASFVPDKNVEASLRREIRRKIGKLKAGYSREMREFSLDEWEEMLFLDGCFLLYFIFCVIYNLVEDLKMKKYEIDSVHNDLFLLENQLPFKLLEILSGNDSDLLDLLDEYVCDHKLSSNIAWEDQRKDPIHLLDRLQTIIMGGQNFLGLSQRRELLRYRPGTKSTVLRPAKELTTRGIHLKLNRSGSLKDISFTSHFFYGILKLPMIIVDESTRTLLLNLAAYEMRADVGSMITSYICLLDSLVNHAEDIRELQSAGILVNHLATDEMAAILFNEMSQGLHPDTDAYMDVKKKIHKFFGDKTRARFASWIAEVYQKYFKSPLTAVAVLAALLALLLAATQTFFTVFPRPNK